VLFKEDSILKQKQIENTTKAYSAELVTSLASALSLVLLVDIQ
jgi:hypothetical protein